MATRTSTQSISNLVINKVASEAAYQDMVANNQVNENELYFVEGDTDSLPSQTGNSGKFLTTNGSAASWATVDALPSQTGNSGKVLSTNGTAASWTDAPEEIFLAEYNVTTYANVLAAYNEGKTVFCKFHDTNAPYIYLPLVYYNSSNNSFLFSAADNSGAFYIFLDLNGGWDAPASVSYSSIYHTHGNLTTDGKVGSTSGYSVYTTTNGAITAGSLTTSDPTASGTSTTFIKTASQDSKGKMTLTKASLPTASSSVAGITTVGASGGAAAYSHGDHIPSQTGNSGKFLTTNGSAASWADIPSGGANISTGTATIPVGTSWSGPDEDTGLYYTTVSITGLTSSKNIHIAPIIDVTDADTGNAQQDAWDTHYWSETVSGGIKFYAAEQPGVAVQFAWEVIE